SRPLVRHSDENDKIMAMINRRRTVPMMVCMMFSMSVLADNDIRVVPSLPTDGPNRLYPGNRPPLLPSPLVKLPIGSITPRGWLRHMLELEANGMTGRLP